MFVFVEYDDQDIKAVGPFETREDALTFYFGDTSYIKAAFEASNYSICIDNRIISLCELARPTIVQNLNHISDQE